MIRLVPLIAENEEQKCKRFIAGLHSRLRVHLTLAPRTHYGELVDAAMRVEREVPAPTPGSRSEGQRVGIVARDLVEEQLHLVRGPWDRLQGLAVPETHRVPYQSVIPVERDIRVYVDGTLHGALHAFTVGRRAILLESVHS